MPTHKKKLNNLKEDKKINVKKLKTNNIKAKTKLKLKSKPAVKHPMEKQSNLSRGETVKKAETISVYKKIREEGLKKLSSPQKAKEEAAIPAFLSSIPAKLEENSIENQRLGFSTLLEEAKNKGYLVHEDLIIFFRMIMPIQHKWKISLVVSLRWELKYLRFPLIRIPYFWKKTPNQMMKKLKMT